MPLPELINVIKDVPGHVKYAASQLKCTYLLLVNVFLEHEPVVPHHWFYVYDKEKLSTRISQPNLLAPLSAPSHKSMLQVEVYGSSEKPFDKSFDEIKNKVKNEIVQMGLAKNLEAVGNVTSQFVPYANVICDLNRRNALDVILSWLGNFGLEREKNDLDAVDEWGDNDNQALGSLILAGRYGQWKYYWTDDCVLRGKKIGRIGPTVDPNGSA
jgi:protoporphyrinogen oxidase